MQNNVVSSLLLSSLLALTACSKKSDSSGSAKAAESTTTTTPSTAPSAPPAALADIDLGKAGDAWKGFRVKGLAGADVTDNGTGGVVINFPDQTMLQLTPVDARDAKAFKQGLTVSYKNVTYSVDTADELVFTTVSDMGGTEIKGYGFSVVVAAGGKKVECGSSYDDEATATRMKAVCKSLAKN